MTFMHHQPTRVLLFLFLISSTVFSQETPFEKSGRSATATWDEGIGWYREMEKLFPGKARLTEAGPADCGKPIHLFVISSSGVFDPVQAKKTGKRILMVNNAIHPGEPEGVDASMLFVRDLLTKPELEPVLEQVIILVIPFYNVDGALNRGQFWRVNQNGPTQHGFRGNARNLDLNRDFLKADSKNARTFTAVFRTWDPDVFVDTHTTDGADYPYTMTVIPTWTGKLSRPLAQYMDQMLVPDLFSKMKDSGFEMSLYVNSVAPVPDSGIADFLDSPRYATGYTSLFDCIGFTTETHMVKEFSPRVEATYQFLLNLVKLVTRDRAQIARARRESREETRVLNTYAFNWELDRTRHDKMKFRGYKAIRAKSELTGVEQVSYDPSQPWEAEIPRYRYYRAQDTVTLPWCYIVPQAWTETIERLKLNGVKMGRLGADMDIEAEVYYLDRFRTSEKPYEGHYNHSDIEVRKDTQKLHFMAGDIVVIARQDASRYIAESLEPQSDDSFFAWNFFDEVLMQKEYFSPWLFEPKAKEMLEHDPELKKAFEAEKEKEPAMRKSMYAQLDFIYRRSPWYEPSHMRYPVVRVMKEVKLEMAR